MSTYLFPIRNNFYCYYYHVHLFEFEFQFELAYSKLGVILPYKMLL